MNTEKQAQEIPVPVVKKQKKKPKPLPKVPKKQKQPTQNTTERGLEKRALHSKVIGLADVSTSVADVQISADFCQNAFYTHPLAIISNLATKVQVVDSRLYGYYWAMLNDLFAILYNKVPLLEQKMRFVSLLYNSFKPKTIKTLRGNFTYSWSDSLSFASNPPLEIGIRGHNYAFYAPAGSDTNPAVPQICAPMSVASIDEAVKDFSELNNLLIKNDKLTDVCEYGVVTNYLNDVSAFSRSSPYFGSGACTSGSAYSSTENELPASSLPVLGNYVEYTNPSNRVSTFLKNGSGDSIVPFGLPFIHGFKGKYFRTAHNIRLKFIDFSEIYNIAVYWMAEALTKSHAKVNASMDFLWAPMPQGAFIGALRQTVLQYFLTTQACCQALTYDDGTSFEPFQVGPTTAPKLNEILTLPSTLVENLRCLRERFYDDNARVGRNDKNVVIYLPVIGLNIGASVWSNPQWYTPDPGSTGTSIFTTVDGYANTIDWVNGHNSSPAAYYNLNSLYFQTAITTWNNWVTMVADCCGTTAKLNGTSTGNLLHLSRYIGEPAIEFDKWDCFPRYMQVPPGYSRRTVRRKKGKSITLRPLEIRSDKPIPPDDYEEFDVLDKIERFGNGGTDFLDNETTTTIVSSQNLPEDLMSFATYIILPKFKVVPTGSPSPVVLAPSKIQVAYKELFYSRRQASTNVSSASNRFTETQLAGRLMAPGLANQASSELDRVVNFMQTQSKGGFLQDILSGAASVAGIIGI